MFVGADFVAHTHVSQLEHHILDNRRAEIPCCTKYLAGILINKAEKWHLNESSNVVIITEEGDSTRSRAHPSHTA